MGYKYFGYFLAVVLLLVTAVGGWIGILRSREKSLLKKLKDSDQTSNQEGGE